MEGCLGWFCGNHGFIYCGKFIGFYWEIAHSIPPTGQRDHWLLFWFDIQRLYFFFAELTEVYMEASGSSIEPYGTAVRVRLIEFEESRTVSSSDAQ
jgi:hypothetical protein